MDPVKLWSYDTESHDMMTSPNGNIFRVTGPLCGEFTGQRWIPLTKDSDVELWCSFSSAPWINSWVNNREASDLRRHRAHHDVIVINWVKVFFSIVLHDKIHLIVFMSNKSYLFALNTSTFTHNCIKCTVIFKWLNFDRESLRWRHNGRDCVSNHQPYDCLFNRLFRRGSKKNSPGPGNSPRNWHVTRKMSPFDDVIMAGADFPPCSLDDEASSHMVYWFINHYVNIHNRILDGTHSMAIW